jgi:hypothetical protein
MILLAITTVTVLCIRATPPTSALAGYGAKAGKLSGVGSAHGIGYAEELQGRSPLVLRDALLQR